MTAVHSPTGATPSDDRPPLEVLPSPVPTAWPVPIGALEVLLDMVEADTDTMSDEELDAYQTLRREVTDATKAIVKGRYQHPQLALGETLGPDDRLWASG